MEYFLSLGFLEHIYIENQGWAQDSTSFPLFYLQWEFPPTHL
jgi:hypothetical protein